MDFCEWRTDRRGLYSKHYDGNGSKAKAKLFLNILDSVTGISSDRILIASSQTGTVIESAGTNNSLGKLISEAVYQCTAKAIKNSQKIAAK